MLSINSLSDRHASVSHLATPLRPHLLLGDKNVRLAGAVCLKDVRLQFFMICIHCTYFTPLRTLKACNKLKPLLTINCNCRKLPRTVWCAGLQLSRFPRARQVAPLPCRNVRNPGSNPGCCDSRRTHHSSTRFLESELFQSYSRWLTTSDRDILTGNGNWTFVGTVVAAAALSVDSRRTVWLPSEVAKVADGLPELIPVSEGRRWCNQHRQQYERRPWHGLDTVRTEMCAKSNKKEC